MKTNFETTLTAKKSLTIAVVLNTAWNIKNFRLGLIRALQEEGHRVIAIAPTDEYAEFIEEAGCQFYDLPNLKRKGMNPLHDLRLMYNLFTIYHQYKVDVALHYTIKPVIFGTIAAWFSPTKSINTLTGLGYAFLSKKWIRWVVINLYRSTLWSSYRVFFQNKDDHQLFEENGLIQAKKSLVVPGSGINTKHFRPQKLTTSRQFVRFLFIGRLLYDKGLREFVEAARRVRLTYPDAQFHLVGELDTGNRAAISIEELSKWQSEKLITYHGKVDDVRSFIEASDVLVLPSYREGLPRVMLEAMAMGKPIIGSDVPGCRAAIVHNENGYLVAVKDAKALADAMQQMITIGEVERQAMGQVGRQMALNRFDERKVVAQYVEVIDELAIKQSVELNASAVNE